MDGSPVTQQTSTLAQQYKTERFVAVDNEIGCPSYVTISSGNDNHLYKFDNSKNYLPSRSESLTAAQEEIKNDSVLLAKKPALNNFIESMKNKKFDVLPVYGYTLKHLGSSIDPYDSYYKENMLQIITGARHAQLNAPLAWRNRPLVIAVFFDYETEVGF